MKSAAQKTDPLAARIVSLIDRHAAPVLSGRSESGTLDTLAKRLGLPDAEHVTALIDSGRLKSLGPVNRNEPDGAQRYASDDLNAIRREVFTEIAAHVIENYQGAPAGLAGAVSAALESYAKSLKDGTAAKGFSARPVRVRHFARYGHRPEQEERPGLLRRTATGAAAVGGLYAGAAYLRGRKIGARGFVPALTAGNAANVATVRKAGERIAGFIRPRRPVGMSAQLPAHVTPARARALLLQFGRQLRRAS